MTAKEHYDNHLGIFYSWMTGDFRTRTDEFKKFLEDNSIKPTTNKIAIDLGAGHGIQSIPLAKHGFNVIAVDFNQQLLDELKLNAKSLRITTINDDIRKVRHFAGKPGLIVCCGDTLSHLDSKQDVETFIANVFNTLEKNGKAIFSFRDYSIPLKGTDRFIPVKSDNNRILTCILDYENDFVDVTDLFHEKTSDGWKQKISTYRKVRLLTSDITNLLVSNGFTITFNQIINRLTTIVVTKP